MGRNFGTWNQRTSFLYIPHRGVISILCNLNAALQQACKPRKFLSTLQLKEYEFSILYINAKSSLFEEEKSME